MFIGLLYNLYSIKTITWNCFQAHTQSQMYEMYSLSIVFTAIELVVMFYYNSRRLK